MWRADGEGGGGSGGWLLLLDHPALLVALAVVVLVLLLIAATTAWVIARRVRRSVVVGRGLLQLKAQGLPPGPGRELATLRLSLEQATDYTARSVALAQQAGRPVGDLPALTRRLLGVRSALDGELALLEREPDPARLRTVLPAARARTEEVTAAATRIRNTLGQVEAADTGAEMAALTDDVATEVNALQAGVTSLRGLGGAGA